MSRKAELEARADGTLREILKAAYVGEPLTVVNAPPGSGKSRTGTLIARQTLDCRERILIATFTNEQARDFACKTHEWFPDAPVTMFVSSKRQVETRMRLPFANVVTSSGKLPTGPAIVIATVDKAGYLDLPSGFDVVLVDEAYQVSDGRYHLVANAGQRHIFIGDPGQIDPIYRSDVRRYLTDKSGPHRPVPTAMKERYPSVIREFTLPVSRRLVDDSAKIIARIFYRGMEFEGLMQHRDRRLIPSRSGGGWQSRLLERFEGPESILGVSLPSEPVGVVDARLVDAIGEAVEAVLEQTCYFEGKRSKVASADVGVVCAHRSQAAAVQARVPRGVFVETANRFQGLERKIIFVWHPASSHESPSDFHLDAGRLCVALSRHQVACAVFYRDGLDERMGNAQSPAARVLDDLNDQAFEGRRIHREVAHVLREREVRVA